jgi:hypothetical protein
MSSLALMEAQRAIYSKLVADGVLMGMVSDVYDVVPQQTQLPYIEIGEGVVQTLAADAMDLSAMRLTLEVWTDASGRKTALAIMNRIYALLHLATIAPVGYALVTLRCDEASTVLREEASRIHGTLAISLSLVEA